MWAASRHTSLTPRSSPGPAPALVIRGHPRFAPDSVPRLARQLGPRRSASTDRTDQADRSLVAPRARTRRLRNDFAAAAANARWTPAPSGSESLSGSTAPAYIGRARRFVRAYPCRWSGGGGGVGAAARTRHASATLRQHPHVTHTTRRSRRSRCLLDRAAFGGRLRIVAEDICDNNVQLYRRALMRQAELARKGACHVDDRRVRAGRPCRLDRSEGSIALRLGVSDKDRVVGMMDDAPASRPGAVAAEVRS